MDSNFMNPETTATAFGVRAGMRVADFGSGSGYFAVLLAKLVGAGGAVTAIDILESALETIKEKAKTEKLNNIKTIRSNLEVVGSSGLEDNSQDLVLIKNMLWQSTHQAEIIKEAQRVLKSDGTLVVIDWKKGLPAGETNGGNLGPPDNLRVSAEMISQMAAAAGLVFARTIAPDAYHFGVIFAKAG